MGPTEGLAEEPTEANPNKEIISNTGLYLWIE